jgi:hypothetical protein
MVAPKSLRLHSVSETGNVFWERNYVETISEVRDTGPKDKGLVKCSRATSVVIGYKFSLWGFVLRTKTMYSWLNEVKSCYYTILQVR